MKHGQLETSVRALECPLPQQRGTFLVDLWP